MIQRWRFAWAWFVAATLAGLLSCNGIPTPEPTPEPTPTPTPWECPLEMRGCHEEPPQQCSTPESPCWHNPTQNPEHCQKAPECGGPGPLPEPQCPTFTDRGGTFRVQGEACDCYFGQVWHPCEVVENQWFPIVPENQITPAASNPGRNGTALNRAMADLTGCAVGQEPCPVSLPVDLWFQAVCKQLHAGVTVGDETVAFYCGRHVESPIGQLCPPGGGCSDQISVKRDSFCDGGIHENYRVINPGENGVRWFPSAKLDAWNVDCTGATWPEDGGPTPPPPTPSPPPGDGCGDPHPSTCTQSQITLKRHGGPNSCRWDSTYQCTRSCEYCAAIGMGSIGGTIRCSCPVRPECGSDAPPDAICHERVACEAEVGAGPNQQWWCDGRRIDPEANPSQAVCCGHVKTCTQDGTTCSEADW